MIPKARSALPRAQRLLRHRRAHGVHFLSRIIGLVRVKYIVWLFGRGMEADALNAAFVLPDMISYFLVGGAASITFVTILTRYREQGREAEGERSLSVILTTMYLVLGAAIVLAEIFAPWYVHWWFNGFDPQKAALCVKLTRILLPAQLCFFAGGVFGAVLLVRKQFSVQAVAPLIYGLGTIVGGLLLVKRIGVSSLAIGTVAGAFLRAVSAQLVLCAPRRHALPLHSRLARRGPARVGAPVVAAHGRRLAGHRRQLDHRPLRLSIGGAVSLMSYAKQLFTAPMAVLAQAAGAASMPFFASLWTQRAPLRVRHQRCRLGLARGRARPARRLRHGGAGLAAIDLVFTGGRFSPADARECAAYFAVFSVSMFLWSAQAIYARAFYAAGNTFVPMVASTIVTVVSLPIYDALFHWRAPWAWPRLRHRHRAANPHHRLAAAQRRMVSLASLDYAEMGRCLLAPDSLPGHWPRSSTTRRAWPSFTTPDPSPTQQSFSPAARSGSS
jgi:putative peptidoglycan lipid II flippase